MAAHLGHGPVATPDDPQVAGGGEGGGRCVVMPVGDHPLGAADGRVRLGERLVQGLERPPCGSRRPRGDPHDVAVAGQCGQCPGVHEDGVDVGGRHVEDQPAGEPQPGGVAPQAVEGAVHLGPPQEELPSAGPDPFANLRFSPTGRAKPRPSGPNGPLVLLATVLILSVSSATVTVRHAFRDAAPPPQ